MDWLQFLSSVIGSLAWPGAVITCVVLLKKPLGRIIPLIRTFKYGGVEINIGTELDAAKKVISEGSEKPAPSLDDLPPVFRQLAEIDPRAAVVSAWAPVEVALRNLATEILDDDRVANYPLARVLNFLSANGILKPSILEPLDHLKRIRDEAVHLGQVSFDDAISMGELCEWTTQKLNALTMIHTRPPSEGDLVSPGAA